MNATTRRRLLLGLGAALVALPAAFVLLRDEGSAVGPDGVPWRAEPVAFEPPPRERESFWATDGAERAPEDDAEPAEPAAAPPPPPPADPVPGAPPSPAAPPAIPPHLADLAPLFTSPPPPCRIALVRQPGAESLFRNCSLPANFTRDDLSPQELYDLAHIMPRRLKDAAHRLGAVVPEQDADVLLVDDEREQRCFMGDQANKADMRRAGELLAARLKGQGPPAILAIDYPLWNRDAIRDTPRAFRFAVEELQVPRETEKSGRHIFLPYYAPDNPHAAGRDPEAKDGHDIALLAACGQEGDEVGARWGGKKRRRELIAGLWRAANGSSRAAVHCRCYRECPANATQPGVAAPLAYLPFPELQKLYADSTFCPVPAGDTLSSRRLSDVMVSGCIPVFIGPWFHSMPWHPLIRYGDFAVFIDIKADHDRPARRRRLLRRRSPPAGGRLHRREASPGPKYRLDPPVWRVPTVDHVLPVLLTIPPARVAELKRGVLAHARYFRGSPFPPDVAGWKEAPPAEWPGPKGNYAHEWAIAAACTLLDKAGEGWKGWAERARPLLQQGR
ncbi:exostosin family-domain-containing protein [Hyaloraphidium curvatum]|nr:exostosin family-domain-containing protein [Hyaloraphidium curvatum]